MAAPYLFGFLTELISINFPDAGNSLVVVEMSYNSQSYSSQAPFPAPQFDSLTQVGTRDISGNLVVLKAGATPVVPKNPVTKDMLNALLVWSITPAQLKETSLVVTEQPTVFQWQFHSIIIFNIGLISLLEGNAAAAINRPRNQPVTCEFKFPVIFANTVTLTDYVVDASWSDSGGGTSSTPFSAIAPALKTIASIEAAILAQHPTAVFQVFNQGTFEAAIDQLTGRIRVSSYQNQTGYPTTGGFTPAWNIFDAIDIETQTVNEVLGSPVQTSFAFSCDPKTLLLTLA